MSLKSIVLGKPSRLSKPFECSFSPLCEGVPGSAKKMAISFELLIDRQLENSFPQSNVMDLNKCLGMDLNQSFNLFSISSARLPVGFKVIITLDKHSTNVITANGVAFEMTKFFSQVWIETVPFMNRSAKGLFSTLFLMIIWFTFPPHR